MKITRILSLVVATVAVFAVTTSTASAHVLFVDRKTNIAAVFHSNPNDDPVAGEDSELFFDIQDKTSDVRIPASGYDLFITDEQGNETKLEVTAYDSTAQVDYVFPSQGLYLLSLRSQPKYDQFQKVVLSGSIRIERGIGVSTAVPSNTVPTLGLVLGTTAIALLTITFINNKAIIIRKSTF